MSKTRIYILILFYFSISQINGQSDHIFKSSQPDIDTTLEKAKTLIGSDNQQATNLISQVIETAKDNENSRALAKAYTILGDININAKLNSLAIRRYKEALSYLIEDDEPGLAASIYIKLGNINELSDFAAAKVYYEKCMSLQKNTNLYYLCYEGLANTLEKQDSLDQAMLILNELEVYYAKKDTSDLARIQARKAIVASSQYNLNLAYINYSNARQNYSISKDSSKDIEILNSAKEIISISQNSLDEEIDFRKKNISDYEENDNTYQIEDQIQLAGAYIKKGDLNNANKIIVDAKKSVSETLNIYTKSKLFKESSEISALRGEYELALKDYKVYESTQQTLIKAKQSELENKIKLLETQKKIDIESNIYDSNKKLGRSESRLVDFQKYIIYLLASLLLLALISALWIYKSLRSKRIANKKLELKSLRAQMNPHFIFNALNSVNEYIATQNEEKANRYLTKFSRLMRKVLDANQKDLIPLTDELELTDLYLKLEHLRFKDQFDYKFIVDPMISGLDTSVSPMLLQPYIENAIWHGLRYKKLKGMLLVDIRRNGSVVEILIEDNGIGRKESRALKTVHQKEHKATGMKNTAQRMNIIEDLYGTKYSVNISDAFPGEQDKGTRVHIQLYSANV